MIFQDSYFKAFQTDFFSQVNLSSSTAC